MALYARTTITARPLGVCASSRAVRSAIRGRPERRSKITSQPVSRPGPRGLGSGWVTPATIWLGDPGAPRRIRGQAAGSARRGSVRIWLGDPGAIWLGDPGCDLVG